MCGCIVCDKAVWNEYGYGYGITHITAAAAAENVSMNGSL